MPVSEALRAVARAIGMEGRLKELEILLVWPRAVGRTTAEHAQPAGLQGGTLLLHVTDSAWLHRLSMMRRDLARNVNDHLDAPVVKAVRLRIGPVGETGAGAAERSRLSSGAQGAGPPKASSSRGAAPEDPAIGRALAPVKDLPFGDVVQRILRRQAALGRRTDAAAQQR